ncbi:uncharacterized protein BP5553_00278 [Venustampulla echinocandica]|uniref:alpha-galactosidase n=1 Tax=Venustampulla echinocandica TaxID=2656787 RepID=A0A370TXP8_9HELO|nr:uncharacterized protein BP5553_00278 [Venustampulla echinocandica]RDL40299.1 hypothetical protein BP5553_00278 [Venustampulla echinocandica]
MLCWFLAACACVGTSLGVEFAVGQKFQIVLSGIPNLDTPLVPADAPVYDIDLEGTSAETITAMKAMGKTVICYFSAGTVENWRPDANKFAAADMGSVLKEWPNERWLKLSSDNVRSIMKTRIQNAATKGCDAIDPDNTVNENLTLINDHLDGYQNTNGLNLKEADTIDYMKFLSSFAASLGLQTGLKNSLAILPNISNIVQFAVNEQCAQFQECEQYDDFIKSGKPVFHIEYPAKAPQVTDAEKKTDCQSTGMVGFSTVLKTMSVDGWVGYCDGSSATTSTSPGGEPPKPPKSTTTAPITTPRTTSKPTPTKTTSSTTRKPTTTAPGGGGSPGGCTQKHWDQCGGNDWKGCTVCAAGFQCKGVSPPWYYQCL